MSEIINDKRKIVAVNQYPHGEDGCYWDTRTHGQYKADAIEAYGEPGLHCELPWLRIIKNGEVSDRVPAISCNIEYEIKPKVVVE